MTRIAQTFASCKKEGRAALITYIMASDPNYQDSLAILKGLPKAGANIIELGMPFSDPMADGPVIQRAGLRSLAADGSVINTLAMVREFREENSTHPIILMGYYNPILYYGVEAFVKDAVAAGVDGVIIVDLPPEEEAEFVDIAEPAGLSHVKLTAPTTHEARAKVVLKRASGFVYYISVAGITGAKSAELNDVKRQIDQLRKSTSLPIAVGFGIKTPEQARDMAKLADAVVVGSALVKQIEDHPSTAQAKLLQLVSDLRKAL